MQRSMFSTADVASGLAEIRMDSSSFRRPDQRPQEYGKMTKNAEFDVNWGLLNGKIRRQLRTEKKRAADSAEPAAEY